MWNEGIETLEQDITELQVIGIMAKEDKEVSLRIEINENFSKLSNANHLFTDYAGTIGFGETEKLPIGVLYQEDRPTYEAQLPQIKQKPLVEQKVEKVDITKLLQAFK